jgi:hypothetical protein
LEDRNLPSTFTVNHLADDLVGSGLNGSLRYCLNQAANGDTITFGVSGTITLGGNELDITKSLDIEGPGADQLAISGNPSPILASRVFGIFKGVTVTIAGLTITGGYVDGSDGANFEGGGIFNFGMLTISNSTISGNFALGGGGIDMESYGDASLTVSNSTLSGNSASGGGGIRNSNGVVTVSNSTLSGNSADEGGGIENDGGTLTVSNSTLSGNSASGSYPVDGGGGIYNAFGTLTVSNCTFTANSASKGGGIYNFGMMTVTNSTVSGNRAVSGGGGLYHTMVQGFPALALLHNTLIAGNFQGATGTTRDDVSGALDPGGDYNLIGDGSGMSGLSNGVNGNLIGSAAAPIDPLLGPLQNNGGPTRTMALLAGSPALNAGDPAQMGVADQRGVLRSGGVNIGAYQASASAFILTAQAPATAGTAFDLTVQAVDPFGKTALGYTGTVNFSSSDGQAVLPSDYAFTSNDAGLHIFSGGVTLKTAGNQTVTATDTVTASITGGATVAVSPAAADHLLFLQQPTDTAAGQTISPVIVEVVDAFGNVETGDNSDTIALSIGANPSGGTLSGTLSLTIVNGVATFSDLSIDLAGVGYTLHASTGGGLPDIDSNPFNITI